MSAQVLIGGKIGHDSHNYRLVYRDYKAFMQTLACLVKT